MITRKEQLEENIRRCESACGHSLSIQMRDGQPIEVRPEHIRVALELQIASDRKGLAAINEQLRRQRVLDHIHRGDKFEAIAAEFGISTTKVIRIAHAAGVHRNEGRIAQRAAVRREVEALLSQGLPLREAARVVGCTPRTARNVLTYMRQVAEGKEVKYT